MLSNEKETAAIEQPQKEWEYHDDDFAEVQRNKR